MSNKFLLTAPAFLSWRQCCNDRCAAVDVNITPVYSLVSKVMDPFIEKIDQKHLDKIFLDDSLQ